MKKLLLLIPLLQLLFGVSVFLYFNPKTPEQKPQKGPVFFDFIKERKGEFPQGAYQIWHQWTRQGKKGPDLLGDVVNLGPDNIGGRTRALLWDYSNPSRIFAGGVSGGLWKSNDSGITWMPVNDQQVNQNITHITQSPFNPDIIYYCTGEGAGNSSAAAGAGIFKSTNGGTSFIQLTSSLSGAFNYTWRIRHSLTDSNTIYVATHDSGLYCSRNAGQSFEKIYNTTNIIHDLEVFKDGTIMFTVERMGIYSSINGNTPFVLKGSGILSFNHFKRIELAYCGTQENVVYAVGCSNTNILAMYRSDNKGSNWIALPTPESSTFRFPWYCLTLNVKYDNPDVLMVGSTFLWYSANAGKNWVNVEGGHHDYHALETHPQRPHKVLIGNDGGVFRCSWTNLNLENLNKGYTTSQCYTGTYAPSGLTTLSGYQDNGTNFNVDGSLSFKTLFGGDGAYCHIHQQQPATAYISWQEGNIIKLIDYKDSLAPPHYIMRTGFDRTWFINPFAMNYLDGEQLYLVSKRRVFRSTDGGSSFNALTNPINIEEEQESFAIGLSYEIHPTAYVGGSNGLFYRINNAYNGTPGQEQNLRIFAPNSVKTSFIGCIKVNPVNPNVIYVGLTNYSATPRIYRVDNAKQNVPVWTNISGNLPKYLPVNWIETDPATRDSVIFIGTDYGLFYTNDAGTTWHKDETIPNVVIDMIKLRHSDRQLFIFTHGRGVWTGKVLPEGKPLLASNQGVNNAENPLEVGIYPNPTRGIVRLNWNPADQPELKVQVLDINGKVLKIVTLKSGEKIDLTSLTPSMYFLTDGKRFSSKILRID